MKNLPLLSLLLSVMSVSLSAPRAWAQGEGVVDSTSRKTTIIESTQDAGRSLGPSSHDGLEQRGVTREARVKVFMPKYKERLDTYTEQVRTGVEKGWLTEAQAVHFRSDIERLRQLDAAVAARSYPEPDLGNLDKQVTQLNIDVANATRTPVATPVKPAVPATITAH